MSKMKLVPIEPTGEMYSQWMCDADGFLQRYKNMLSNRPTVEVVDVENFKEEFRKQFSVIEPMHDGENDDELKKAILTNMQVNSNLNFLDYLTNSGYTIIKETN